MNRKGLPFFVIILLLSINYLMIKQVTGNIDKAKNLKLSKEEIRLTNFTDFEIFSNQSTIWSNKTDSGIEFGYLEDTLSFVYESYGLDFDKFGGNCTDLFLEIHFDYQYQIEKIEGSFNIELGSYFGFDGQYHKSYIINTLAEILTYRQEAQLSVRKSAISSKNIQEYNILSTNGSACFKIVKTGRTLECAIIDDLTDEKIISKKWYSSYFYIPVNYIIISFNSLKADFSVEINEIDALLTLEERDWLLRKTMISLTIGLSAGFGSLLLIIFVITGYSKGKAIVEEDEKYLRWEANKEKLPHDKYLDKLEKTLKKTDNEDH
ncbi:MAG: hypothetical protein FK734_19585 [Asgard group archaeon]|nr:hypothetical protein [Asgard group archaeon]